jgi:hypothetical protein
MPLRMAARGLLLGLGLAFLLERFDRRIREPKDLEAIYGLPLLGVVPESAALSRSSRGKKNAGEVLPAGEAEASPCMPKSTTQIASFGQVEGTVGDRFGYGLNRSSKTSGHSLAIVQRCPFDSRTPPTRTTQSGGPLHANASSAQPLTATRFITPLHRRAVERRTIRTRRTGADGEPP